MIEELTTHLASKLNLTVGTSAFARDFLDSRLDPSLCVKEGRFSNLSEAPDNNETYEIIVEGSSISPNNAEAISRLAYKELVNKAGVAISDLGTVTCTGRPPVSLPRDTKQWFIYAATLVITLKQL